MKLQAAGFCVIKTIVCKCLLKYFFSVLKKLLSIFVAQSKQCIILLSCVVVCVAHLYGEGNCIAINKIN